MLKFINAQIQTLIYHIGEKASNIGGLSGERGGMHDDIYVSTVEGVRGIGSNINTLKAIYTVIRCKYIGTIITYRP